jgi:putative flavoprotein involved in K+ transport
VIVGSGASGCQIADELLEAGRSVFLSVGRHRRVPRRYRGHDVFWWRRELGELDQLASSLPPHQRPAAAVVTGVHGGYDIDLRHSAARGMHLLGHLVGAADGSMAFADDLENTLREGDQAYRDFLSAVDVHVSRMKIDVPDAPDTADADAAQARPTPLVSRASLNLRSSKVAAVIWAIGYALDFGWIDVPVFDAKGVPQQHRGITSVPGLYFLGLRWMHKMKSSFLCGVGDDAAHIASCIARLGGA